MVLLAVCALLGSNQSTTEVSVVPVDFRPCISIAGDDTDGYVEVSEGGTFKIRVTVTDSDTKEQFSRVNGKWLSQGSAKFDGQKIGIDAGIKSGTYQTHRKSGTSGTLVHEYEITASAGKDYWKKNPKATYFEIVDSFRPTDSDEGNARDEISKSNAYEVLVRIKKPSK